MVPNSGLPRAVDMLPTFEELGTLNHLIEDHASSQHVDQPIARDNLIYENLAMWSRCLMIPVARGLQFVSLPASHLKRKRRTSSEVPFMIPMTGPDHTSIFLKYLEATQFLQILTSIPPRPKMKSMVLLCRLLR